MQHKRICLGLFAAFAGLVAAEGAAESASEGAASQVTQLTEKTFNEFIEKNDIVLAEFFAPWCGHCKALAPEYEIAATDLKKREDEQEKARKKRDTKGGAKSEDKKIKLVKIDCTEEADLCQTHGVEGYPTLKVFRGIDNVSPYSGQRKAKEITSFMIKQSLPAVSTLDKDTLEAFKTADKVVVVAYVADDDKTSTDVFATLADKYRNDYFFGSVADAALAEAEGVKVPGVVVYKSFDEGKNVFKGKKFEAEAIEEFTKVAATPLIGEIGPETYAAYMSSGLPLAYIFAETEEERTELSKTLKSVAEKHRGKVNFATIDADAFGAHAANLNLKTDKFPSFAIQDMEGNKKFPFDQEKKITEKSIGKFVDDYVAGKIEPSIKSEPIPETQDGPVSIVVAKNYDEIVLDDKKDVLIEFYAPWCGHCKSLAPKYDQLGEAFKKSEFKDKVTIAKVDATLNDVPDDISGFPTIKLYPAGDKKNPVTYSGARTVDDLNDFIKEHGKYKAHADIGEATEEAAPAASKEKKSVKEEEEEEEDDHDEL